MPKHIRQGLLQHPCSHFMLAGNVGNHDTALLVGVVMVALHKQHVNASAQLQLASHQSKTHSPHLLLATLVLKHTRQHAIAYASVLCQSALQKYRLLAGVCVCVSPKTVMPAYWVVFSQVSTKAQDFAIINIMN